MKKNIFDKMSDSYDEFHLKESEINLGNETIYIHPKLKLALGWSVFLLCCVLAYFLVGRPLIGAKKDTVQQPVSTENTETSVTASEQINVKEEHDTIVPYEKDTDLVLNEFIEVYFMSITHCDNEKLQDMVTDPTPYLNNENLKKKAQFITGYNDITVYTKEGLEEGSYVAFVVANITIANVKTSPYDIMTLYIVSGDQGYRVNNGEWSQETIDYINKVKGDQDIQEVYKLVESENAKLREQDPDLQAFYDKINGAEEAEQEDETKDASETPEPEEAAEETVDE